MHNLILMLFALGGGLALSGIVANLYRIVGRKPDGRVSTLVHYSVMVLAGPSVLFQNATKSFRGKACSGTAYGFAVAIAGYWSLMIGLIIIKII